jgi:hypothetical protein
LTLADAPTAWRNRIIGHADIAPDKLLPNPRNGSRAGWTKVKDRSWYEREAWRFDRR